MSEVMNAVTAPRRSIPFTQFNPTQADTEIPGCEPGIFQTEKELNSLCRIRNVRDAVNGRAAK